MTGLLSSFSSATVELDAPAPISRLPPEILELIFAYLVHRKLTSWYHGSTFCSTPCLELDRSSPLGPRPAVIDVSQVCRQWRQVAAQSSRLWSNPPLDLGITWTRAFFTRSGSAPLTVEAHTDGPVLAPEMIHLIHAQICRIRTLDVSASSVILDQLMDGLTRPARMLENVTFETRRQSSTVTVLARIPECLFAGNLPDYCSINLTNCIIPWYSFTLCNLTTLSIRFPDADETMLYENDGFRFPVLRSEILPTMSQLLDVLKANPFLTCLTLINALPAVPLPTQPGYQDEARGINVCLPNLDEVFLAGYARDCAVLLSHLILPSPPLLFIELSFQDDEDEEAQCAAILRSLKALLSSHEVSWYRANALDFAEVAGTVEIRMGTSEISIPVPIRFKTYTDFLRTLFTTHPMAESVELSFDDGNQSFSPTQLLYTFAHKHADCIRSVSYQGYTPGAMCEALGARQEGSFTQSTSDPTFLLFPHLKTLEFYGMYDPRTFEDDDRIMHLEDMQTDFIDLLVARKQGGSPIQALVFDHCFGIDQEWCDALRVVDETVIRFCPPLCS